MADKQDWKTISMIVEQPNRVASHPAVSNQVTEYAREFANKRRTAAGVSSILDFGGPSGSSIPSVLAQNSAISSLLYTMSRADKLQLFRYFQRHDPMVGRAIDLHTELPMSRVTIGPPKGPSPRQNKEITRIYETMCEDIDIFNLLLDIPREFWLCFHPDSRVKLGDGLSKKISDVRVGDLVLTGKGRLRPVLGIKEKEVEDYLYVIRARGLANPIRVTEDHVLFTLQGDRKAKELSVGDELYFQPPVEEVPQGDITDEHCFLAGWYLAEGSVKNDTSLSVFSLFREKVFDSVAIPKIKELLEKLFSPEVARDGGKQRWNGEKRESSRRNELVSGYTGSCRHCGASNEWLGNAGTSPNGKMCAKCYFCDTHFIIDVEISMLPYESGVHDDRCVNICYCNRKAHQFFLEECGQYSHHKVLKDRWLYLPKNQQRILFRAWLEGDAGVSDENYVRAVTTSYKLLEQMYWIASRLGINPRVRTYVDGEIVDADTIRDISLSERADGKYNSKVLVAYELGVSEREYIECVKGEVHWYDRLFFELQEKWESVVEEPTWLTDYRYPDEAFQQAVISRYTKEGWKSLGPEFGYSQATVARVAKKSGVVGPNRDFWTKEKDEFLIENYLVYGPTLLGRLWGREFFIIQKRAQKFDLQFEGGTSISIPWKRPLEDGRVPLRISSIEKEMYQGKVYDLVVNEDNSYIVENACVHNCGDVYVWCHWNEELLTIDECYVLPVEYMHSIIHPFNRKKEIVFFAKPLVDTAAIRRITDRDLYLVADTDIERLYESLGDSIPEELKEALNYGEAVPLNTNWRRGSFCIHLSRDRPPNEEYGIALIERNMDTLLRLENLKNANFQISSRNMAPKYIVSAPGASKDVLVDLRVQFDLALLENADYPIVTNADINIQVLGANDRLLNTESEYNTLRQDLAMGLGSTVDMLTGASTYGGQRITLEMMNTQYLRLRDVMKTFVERGLFMPIGFAKGHYMEEEIEMWPRVRPEDTEVGDILIEERDGHLRRKRTQINTVWLYSSLRFNRVSLRDNAEVYDQLFQLYQKGSLAVRYLLELHNIDPEENSNALLEDLGTPRDATMNDFIRALYTATDVPQRVVSQTDFIDRVKQGLKLVTKVQPPLGGAPGGGMGGMGGGLSDMGGLGGMPPMGGPGGEMGGEMGGMGGFGGEPGAEVGGETAPPAGPGAGGAPPAGAPAPAASRRHASRRESALVPLAGRLLAPEVAKQLQLLAEARYVQGSVLSAKEVKREIRRLEHEAKKTSPDSSQSRRTATRRNGKH
jgi:intein/homing endonuclease